MIVESDKGARTSWKLIGDHYMKKLLLLWIIAGVFFPKTALGESQPTHRQITVMGEAVVNVEPDSVVLTLGIETADKEIAAAKAANARIIQKVIAVCTQHGVEQKNIGTDHLYLEPRYDDYYKKQGFLAYYVRNTIAITITDVTTLETILTELLQIGVNYVHGIEFQTTKFKEYRQQARELALRAAQEKATQMAAVLSVTIGQPLEIIEMENASNWWYSGWWGYSRSQSMSQNVAQNVSTESNEPGEMVALGKIGIRAKIQVIFALE